jgi:hypothetical protein
MDVVGWYPFAAGGTIGETGSENGIILRDEEYSAGARITLERDGYTPFAITCGIYGWMVHTRFFATEREADEAFAVMKAELARIVDLIASRDDPRANERASEAGEDIRAFIEDFP